MNLRERIYSLSRCFTIIAQYIIVVCCMLISAYSSAFAQQNNFNQDLFNGIKFFDAAGKPFVNPAADYNGFPFLINTWNKGIITLTNDTSYVNNYTKLNLETGEILFLNSGKQQMALPGTKLKSFSFVDSLQLPAAAYFFKNGFPVMAGHGPDFLYRVITKGKLVLLEAIEKRLYIDNNAFSGETTKVYRTHLSYYLFNGVVIKKLPHDQATLLGYMKDHQTEIELFIKNSHLDVKETADVKQLFDYYNSIADR